MNVTASLFGQMITFAIFVWITMKYVWPPITKAMQERQKKIADGLKAAEEGEHKLVLAQAKATDILREAKAQGAALLDEAKQRGNSIIEEHKVLAREEGARLVALAQSDIEQEVRKAESELRAGTSNIALQIAGKVLERDVNVADHVRLMDELIENIQRA